MTKDEVLQVVRDIAVLTVNEDTIDQFYDDVLNEIGRGEKAPLVESSLVEVTFGVSSYTIPSNGVEIHSLFHCINNADRDCRQLSLASVYELEAYDDGWVLESGDSFFYTREDKTSRTFQLSPTPDATSSGYQHFTGNPLGYDMPTNICLLIYSERRDTDIPDWFGVYVALRILAKEFNQVSDHQDLAFVASILQVAQTFAIIGGLF